MKYRNIAILVIIASFFLLFKPNQVASATAGTTVKLMVPNLPSGG